VLTINFGINTMPAS